MFAFIAGILFTLVAEAVVFIVLVKKKIMIVTKKGNTISETIRTGTPL